MKLSQITIFKNFLFLFILSFLITSCEPEEIPTTNNIKSDSSKIYLDTGDEENPPETKKV